jgi:hypothetical protein
MGIVALTGCGSGTKEVTITEDPQEVERLRPMMPPNMRNQPPPQPQDEQPAPEQ